MPDYGADVSRTIPVGDSAFLNALHLKKRPSVDAEHNFNSDIADHLSASRIKALAFSGILNNRSAGLDEIFIPTLDPNFVTTFGKHPNEFAIQNFDAKVNGWIVPVRYSNVGGGNYDDPNYISIELPPAPAPSPMSRQDLVFLEVWRALVKAPPSAANKPSATEIYRYGNVQYAGTNLPDDLIQPDIPASTSHRIQLQYRIRVATGVNFDMHEDGVDDPNVMPQGGAASPSPSWNYVRAAHDPGLYVAGDGDPSAIADLNTVDGVVFAIPLLKVHRRNSAAYALNNPNGSSSDITDTYSDRPDGLFFDEVALRDVVDLRHDILTNSSYSELLEDNFDALLRQDLLLEFGRDAAIDNQIQGTSMLAVDGYSVIDQSGVYDLPFDPNFLRRDYSEEVRTHFVVFKLDTSAGSITSGPVLYDSGTNLLQINIASGNLLSEPEIYTEGTLRPDGVDPGGWTGIFPGASAAGTLNAAYVGQVVTINMEVAYNPNGHRYVANEYFKVYNARAVNPEEWAFTVNPTDFTQVREPVIPGLPSVFGVFDKYTQYPIATIDTAGNITYPVPAPLSTLSYTSLTETYDYHVQGNGTNQYLIPPSVSGVDVLGIYAVHESDDAPISFNQIDPTSIIRNIDGSYTVLLASTFATTKVLKFILVLDKTGTVLDRSTKGLKEIMKMESAVQLGDATDTYTFQFDGIPYGFASYLNSSSASTFYAYVNGSRVDILEANVNVSLNQVTVTFTAPAPTGQEVRFYALVGYQPVDEDRIQITYDRKPYQGMSDPYHLDGARVLAVGKNPLLHSIGTSQDTDVRNLEMGAISENLPLAFGFLDADLKNEDLSLSNTQFSAFKMLRLGHVSHDYRIGSGGKLPVPGDIIQLTDVLVEPERGIKDKVINLKNRLDLSDYPMEFISPALDVSKSHQLVHYFLIQSRWTKELYMLVMTYMDTSVGNALVKSSVAESGVAYDLFKIKGKPILKK
jgi:hypothetical protein